MSLIYVFIIIILIILIYFLFVKNRRKKNIKKIHNLLNRENELRIKNPVELKYNRQDLLELQKDFIESIYSYEENDDFSVQFLLDRSFEYNNFIRDILLNDETDVLENAGIINTINRNYDILLDIQNYSLDDTLQNLYEDNFNINKEQITNKYLDKAKTHTNDPQNVHDVSINKDLVEIYNKIINTSIGRKDFNGETIEDIKRYVSMSQKPNKIQILDVIDVMNNNKNILPINKTEKNVLLAVWNRTYDINNVQNTNNMKEAVINALEDCYENGKMVCANGRIARVLTSLVLLDHDPSIGIVQTQEQYKNELLDEVQKILKTEIQQALNSPNEEMRLLGKSFSQNVDESKISPEIKLMFKKNIEEKIDIEIAKNKDKLPHNIKQIIMIGIDI